MIKHNIQRKSFKKNKNLRNVLWEKFSGIEQVEIVSGESSWPKTRNVYFNLTSDYEGEKNTFLSFCLVNENMRFQLQNDIFQIYLVKQNVALYYKTVQTESQETFQILKHRLEMEAFSKVSNTSPACKYYFWRKKKK